MPSANWKTVYSKSKGHIEGHDAQTLPYLLEVVRVDGLTKSKNALEISISFYDSAANACYGSTWRSLSLQQPFIAKQELVFHSEISATTMLLVEVIQIDSSTYKKQILGWTCFKVFNNNITNKKFEIYHGSSRAIFFLQEPTVANSRLLKREGVTITISLNQRGVVRSLTRQVPANYFTSPSHLTKLNRSVEPLTLFLENIEVFIGTDVKKFDNHIVFLLMADAKHQNSNIRDFDKVTIKERRLKACVHNGLRYTDEFQVVYLENVQNVTSQCLKSKGVISLSSIDPRHCIVFSLEYVLEVPLSFTNLTLVSSMRQSQVHIIALRWGIWSPSSHLPNSGSVLSIPISGGPQLNPEKKLVFTDTIGTMNSLKDASVTFKLIKQEGELPSHDELDLSYAETPVQTDGAKQLKSTLSETQDTCDFPTVTQAEVQQQARMPTLQHLTTTPQPRTTTPQELLEPLASENILHYDIKSHQQDIVMVDMEKAAYAQIHNAGFPDLVDSDARPALELDLSKHYVYSPVLEKNDHRTCNSVYFQFLAVSLGNKDIVNMFFTVQFYHFVAETTPILAIQPNKQNLPCILYKQDGADRIPGCIVSFKVDPGEDADEPTEFLKHIQTGTCIIDMWNSDSLFHAGSVTVKLKRLARQGEHGVQTTQVFNINVEDYCVGKLHLRVANIGSIPQLYDLKDIGRTVIIDLTEQDEQTELIVRPKPLSNTDKNLASILSSQSFQKSTRSRKLERMEAVRTQHETTYILSTDEDKALRASQLTMIRNYRTKIQNDVIREKLVANITRQHTLYVGYGSVAYFEVNFANATSADQVYLINWDATDIRLIYDTDECKALKALYNITTPLDENVFSTHSSPAKLVLRPNENIYIPFLYNSTSTRTNTPYTVKFTTDKNSPVSILNLHFKQTRQILSERFKFYEPENSFAKHSIRVSGILEEGQLKVKSSSPDIICNVDANNHIFFKAPVPKSNEVVSFLLILYMDKYCYRPYQIWEVTIYALKRVDINAVVGSQTTFPVILRGTDTVRCVSCFSSDPGVLQIWPDREFVLMPGTIQEVKLIYAPLESGAHQYMVNVVDMKHKIVVERWMVKTSASLPIVSKTYDIPVSNPLTPTYKTIAFTNPYSTTKSFKLKCNKPDLITFKSTELTIPSNESQNLSLILSPLALSHPNYILVFVNDVAEKCEECFALRISGS